MNNPQSADELLATPAIWVPGMNEEEFDHECNLMVERAFAVRSFLQGEISPAEFEEMLAEFAIDPYVAAAAWEQGHSFLYG